MSLVHIYVSVLCFYGRMTIDRPDAEMRGVLKRRFAEVEEEASYVSSSPSSSSSSSPLFSSEWESDGENQLILPAPRAPAQPASAPSK
jgi:hypothetical protein